MKTMIPGDLYRIPKLDGKYRYIPVVREVKGERVAILTLAEVGDGAGEAPTPVPGQE